MTEIIEPYGFIYITTNLINGKRYLGQKKFDKYGDYKNYLGSGVAFEKAVKKYGRKNFKRDIITFCYSKEELNKAEYDLSVFLNVVESDDWYNLVLGGGATSGCHLTNETKEKISKSKTGKPLSEYHKNRISEGLKGIVFSEEHKKKIANAMTGKKSPRAKAVLCIELNREFASSYDAEMNLGINRQSIRNVCNDKQKTAGGYHWCFVSEEVAA